MINYMSQKINFKIVTSTSHSLEISLKIVLQEETLYRELLVLPINSVLRELTDMASRQVALIFKTIDTEDSRQ